MLAIPTVSGDGGPAQLLRLRRKQNLNGSEAG
jgi:hypothetical protein